MDSATNQNQRRVQRTRVIAPTDNDDDANNNNNVTPPLTLAEAFLRSSVASLQTNLATIIEKLGKEHIRLLSHLDTKKAILKKLNDNTDFIPSSARIKFQITGSKRTEQRPEFITLVEETSVMVNRYRTELRAQVIKALTIEITTIEDEVREHLLKAIRLITKSIMITNKDNGDADYKINTLMAFYLPTLSKNCLMDMDRFKELYKKVHTLETFPPPKPANLNMMDDQPDIIPADIKKLKTIIHSAFVTTWAKYQKQQETNMVAGELKRLSAGYFTDRDTAVAVSHVDLEPSADKPELQALIRKETQAENKTLRQELNTLKQQLAGLKKSPNNTTAQKSNTRGRKGGASRKTNATNPNPTTSNRNNQNKNNNKRKNNGANGNNNTHPTTANGRRNKNEKHQRQHGSTAPNPNQKADGNNNDTANGKKKRKANHGSNPSQPNKNSSTKRRKISQESSNNE
jgi:hypothetical protein